MPLALILSSYIAAGRIGGGAQQIALAVSGIDPVLVPTVMLGASPAKGGRGRATDPELFQQLLDGVEGQGVLARLDLLITGHFSLPEQVLLACATIEKARASSRQLIVIVDPVLGDSPKGLYVIPEVAQVLAARLVPLADWLTPNLWELSHLTGREIADAAGAAAAVQALGKSALVTSAPAGAGEIGLLCCEPTGATLIAHGRVARAPNGTGDLVTAMFGAGLVEGLEPSAAAERAARAVAQALAASDGDDLPLIALGERLVRPTTPVRIERLA